MDEIIKIGNTHWNAINCDDNTIYNKPLYDEFISWYSYSTPTKYIQCNGANMAIRKCTFKSIQFIECDFSHIDASDSIFIDCLFKNCNFRNANFHKSSFIGTAIIQDGDLIENSYFEGAGMAQTCFLASNENNCVLANLKLNSLGFRHSIFKSVFILGTNIEHASFEDAYFEQCNIDIFNSRSSSCRGVIFKKCKIDKYVSSLEKTIGAIGALELLKDCKEVELYFGDEQINLKELKKHLKLGAENFIKEGKLFEIINIMHFLYYSAKYLCVEDVKEAKEKLKVILLSDDKLIDGYKIHEIGILLYYFVMKSLGIISENGKNIDLDNILYTLKLLYFFDIKEYILLRAINDLFDTVKITKHIDYSDFLTTSQIEHYLNEIGFKIMRESYRVELINEKVSLQNFKEIEKFYNFSNTLIKCSGINNYSLISIQKGSIEAIYELIDPYKLLMVVCILGIDLKYDKVEGLSFKFNPQNGIKCFSDFLKQVATIPFPNRDNNDENVFIKILKLIPKSLMKYINANNVSGKVKQQRASEYRKKIIKGTTERKKKLIG